MIRSASTATGRLTAIPDRDGNLPVEKKLPANVALLRQRAHQLERDAQAAKEEADAKVMEAQQLQASLSRLQSDADRAADTLTRADNQFAQFQNAIASMEAGLATAWGTSNGYGDSMPAPNYSDVVACERAVAAYPKVREALLVRLDKAEGALAAFNRQHNL